METIKTIYKIGSGPSSSHTMGPELLVQMFLKENSEIIKYEVDLYGSLALTGKGHLTDEVIKNTFKNIPGEINFNITKKNLLHPNQLKITGYFKDGSTVELEGVSIGGGNIKIVENGKIIEEKKNLNKYEHTTIKEILKYCEENDISLIKYIIDREDEDIREYLKKVYDVMEESIKRGIKNSGTLPGRLKVKRRANKLYESYVNEYGDKSALLSAYAYAVNEENAGGGKIVTAPTCGACGTLPAVLKYYQVLYLKEETKIIDALMIAGLIGTLVRHNASISGAEAGCQAEVGTATAMAAAATMYLIDPKVELRKIEAAAEIALTHQLGLTCDPVLGYVQIPCIQRNPIAANKALLAAKLAKQLLDDEVVDFDAIVEVMYQTGKDMKSEYRETSTGGIAKFYKDKAFKNLKE